MSLNVCKQLFLLGLCFVTKTKSEKLNNKEAYENLKRTVKSVKESCGEICDTKIDGKPGKYFDVIKKNFQCDPLFSNSDIDVPLEFKYPPERVPKWLRDDYTYHGKVEIVNDYYDETGDHKSLFYNFSSWVVSEINRQLDLNILKGMVQKGFVLTFFNIHSCRFSIII